MYHHFCFSFCWWDLIGRFIAGTVFSFQIFFPTLNILFAILFDFQEMKKAQQTCQLCQCYRESPSFNRFHRFYWIVTFFPQYCLAHASKQSFIWELFHLLSKAFFLHVKLFILLKVLQNISDLKNTESNITVTYRECFLYFSRDDLFNNQNFKTNTRLWNNNNTWENWQ